MRIQFIENIKNHVGLFFNSPIKKGTKKEFVFIHITKTGGTSIVDVTGRAFRKHLTVKEVIKYVGKKNWDQVFTFTVIRNPWDKVVSQYKFRTKTNKSKMKDNPISFKDWVVKVFDENDPYYYGCRPLNFAPQTYWLKDFDGEINLDYIIQFENLNEDFKEVAEIIGVDPNLPHLNSTKKTGYRDFYDDKTKKIVEKWFEEDIETFGYTF